MIILFVERDHAPRRWMKDLLEAAGARIVEAELSGRMDAAAFAPQLVLVELSNAEDAAVLREIRGTLDPGTALIALVGAGVAEDVVLSVETDEVLAEPVSMDSLFAAIAAHLPPAD
ncbi:hypothetical protein SAMN05192583_2306 [Sphingomonas gellani]|uniref:Response regulatory domain-containing protein n=1 Tax=Sphingomonas gellani TaxID=1166340 RepID=A0A1H8ETL3_9SPHN|nr:response regulator transcription factor [Sphingomonas gellani]SEN22951.1 hypothetical protein SAMN05192583_2306 [Sphingomonas gellani]